MPVISKIAIDGFSRTPGTVIGGKWNGSSFVPHTPVATSNSATTGQSQQRSKFAVAVNFLQSLSALVAHTFKDFNTGSSGFNKAMSHLVKCAVTGTAPHYRLSYSHVLVSRGSLPNAADPGVDSGAPGIVTFRWTDNNGQGKATGNDTSVLVVYCEELNISVYMPTGAVRSAGACTLDIPGFSGKTVHTWIGFLSADGKDAATSIYTGPLTIL